MKRGTVVGVEVDQLRTVLEDDGDDGVLDHLPELDVTQGLEARPRHLPRDVVAAVAHAGGGLQAVFELDGEHLQLITVVEYFGHVKLWNVDGGVRLLVHDKLQTHFLQILRPLAVLEVVDDAGEHGVGVADPDERHLLEVGEVGQVRDVEQRLPAGEGADQREHVDQIVHPGVGNLPGVQRHQRKLVYLHAAHHTQRPQEGVGDRVLAQTVQDVDLLAELLQAHVGDAGVGDVDVAHGAADGVQHLLHLHQHRGAVVGVRSAAVGEALAEAGPAPGDGAPAGEAAARGARVRRGEVLLHRDAGPGQLRQDLHVFVILINLLSLVCKQYKWYLALQYCRTRSIGRLREWGEIIIDAKRTFTWT